MTDTQDKPTPKTAEAFTQATTTPVPQETPRELDGYGRNVASWIDVNGKKRPHP